MGDIDKFVIDHKFDSKHRRLQRQMKARLHGRFESLPDENKNNVQKSRMLKKSKVHKKHKVFHKKLHHRKLKHIIKNKKKFKKLSKKMKKRYLQEDEEEDEEGEEGEEGDEEEDDDIDKFVIDHKFDSKHRRLQRQMKARLHGRFESLPDENKHNYQKSRMLKKSKVHKK